MFRRKTTAPAPPKTETSLGFRFQVSRGPECCGSPMRQDKRRGWVCIVRDH